MVALSDHLSLASIKTSIFLPEPSSHDDQTEVVFPTNSVDDVQPYFIMIMYQIKSRQNGYLLIPRNVCESENDIGCDNNVRITDDCFCYMLDNVTFPFQGNRSDFVT